MTTTTNINPKTESRFVSEQLVHSHGVQVGYGTIIFRPIQAKFNRDEDLIDKLNPYCKFKIGWHSSKSSVAEGQGVNAHWNDVIRLKVKGQETATVKVKEKERLGGRLGKGKISLSSVFPGKKITQWVSLHKGEKVTGEILVEIEYIPKH